MWVCGGNGPRSIVLVLLAEGSELGSVLFLQWRVFPLPLGLQEERKGIATSLHQLLVVWDEKACSIHPMCMQFVTELWTPVERECF